MVENEIMLLILADIDILELPFVDGGSPSSEMIRVFIDFLDMHSNNAVVVHCRAGFGREFNELYLHS